MSLPGVKDVVTKSCLASFSRTLSSLNSAGVPLLDSIQISKRTMTNILLKGSLTDCIPVFNLGDLLTISLPKKKFFSNVCLHVPHWRGDCELSAMVDKLAEFYEEEVSTSIKTLTSILEPLMIVIVALVVAILLVAMYLPMFNMMSTVK